jgi:pilus assembly protein Flp/PilA
MSDKKRLSRRGLTAIEYGLLAALVAVGLIVSLSTMSNNISAMFVSVGGLIGSEQNPVVGPGQAPPPPNANPGGWN